MYELYMNTSIVFISWKVESRVKEANTINNIDNNVIKKDIDIMIFWIRFKIQSIILTIFIDIDLSKILLIIGEHFWIKLLLCVHIFIDIFLFFFLDLIYINDTWRYMKIVMRYLFFLSYSKNSKNFAYYDRKKIWSSQSCIKDNHHRNH